MLGVATKESGDSIADEDGPVMQFEERKDHFNG